MTVDDAAALAVRLLELKLGGVAVPKCSLGMVLARMISTLWAGNGWTILSVGVL